MRNRTGSPLRLPGSNFQLFTQLIATWSNAELLLRRTFGS